MSFSREVKEELAGHISPARHCQIAELSALFSMCGQFGRNQDGYYIGFQTENEAVLKKSFTLLKKAFNIEADAMLRKEQIQELYDEFGDLDKPVNQLLIKNSCCQRAFIRGSFLAAGSMSDPSKGYHLEFVCTSMEKAGQLQRVIQEFNIDAKIVIRKKYYVVYLKEGSGIVDILNVMEAHVALMQLENVRIVKEMRNSINRRVNCETANITKTVSAAVRQIDDIRLIDEVLGLHTLPDALRDIAEVRLQNPDAPLHVLGNMLTPPVGKSGVNHRLRKLSQMAEEIRENKEEQGNYEKAGSND